MHPTSVSIFLPDVVGGVESVVRNLVTFVPPDLEVDIELILYNNVSSPRKAIAGIKEGLATKRVSFHSQDNFYSIARKLKKATNKRVAVIVATDDVELVMLEIEKLKTRVVYLVLGDFNHYYKAAVRHEGVIDAYVAISKEIYNKLRDLLPERVADIKQYYFPTPPVYKEVAKTSGQYLKLIYVARLEDSKNPLLLLKIDDILKASNIFVEWTIVGDGPERSQLEINIASRNNFKLTGFLDNEKLHQLYLQHDLFVMTSFHEGLPVSLIEAMKTGLVPVISDIDGGVREIVSNRIDGYLCNPNAALEFANAIKDLHIDRIKLGEMEKKAEDKANQMFDHKNQAADYWNVIMDKTSPARSKRFEFKGSTLDRRFIPNFLVRLIRSVK